MTSTVQGFAENSFITETLRLDTFGLAELYPEKESALFKPGFLDCLSLPLTLVASCVRSGNWYHPQG